MKRIVTVAVFCVLAPGVIHAGLPAAADLLDVLQPGSRPSIALGGDPFLSPLRDETGWWSDGPNASRPFAEVEARHSNPISAGAVRGIDVIGDHVRTRLGAPFQLRNRSGGLLLEMHSPRWSNSWNRNGEAIGLTGSGAWAEVECRLADATSGLTAQVSVPLWSSEAWIHSPGLRAGLRCTAIPRVQVQGSWARALDRRTVDSDLYQAPWSASLNLDSETWRMDAAVEPVRAVRVEGSVLRTEYSSAGHKEDADAYQLFPAGGSGREEASVHWRPLKRLDLLYRWTRADLDIAGRAAFAGQEFGYLTYLKGRLQSSLFAFRTPGTAGGTLLLDLELAGVDGRSRGSFESWPFSSTLVDLLGERRIFKANGSADWQRLHLGFARHLGRRAEVRFGTTGYRIRPELNLESWAPALLIFGRRDVQVSRLEWERVDLAAVSGGIGFMLGKTRLSGEFRQFVYAYAKEPGSNSRSGGSESSKNHAWPGGTLLHLCVARQF